LAARDRLALRIYWYSQSQSAGIAAIGVIPLIVLMATIDDLPARYAAEYLTPTDMAVFCGSACYRWSP